MACYPEIENPPQLPGEIPVMVLPDCHLFPGCLLPLYIFEERYRLMLEHLLRADRIFCIGNRFGDSEDEVSDYSTAGLIRACIKQTNGTSHLLMLGLQRIRICDWVQERPYRIAKIEPITSEPGDVERTRQLREEVLDLFARQGENARELSKTLIENDNLELVGDVLSYHFTRCPTLQQKLLAERNVERRYEMILAALKKYQPKNQ